MSTRPSPHALLGSLDARLGRLPMYRLVTLALLVLAAWALVLIGTDRLLVGFTTVPDAVLGLLVLVGVAVASNVAVGRLVGARPHHESALITGLLLWFVLLPPAQTSELAWFALTALLATASKYVLAVRGRHVVNPAAAGLVLVLTLQHVLEPASGVANGWWVANEAMTWPVVVLGLLVLVRTRKVGMAAAFAALATALVVAGMVNVGSAVGDAVSFALVSSPALFLAAFMLSEPLTLPPRRGQQYAAAAVAALVYAWPNLVTLFVVDPAPLWFYGLSSELALVASGLVGFALGQRGGVRLRLTSKRRVAGDTWELAFAPRRPLRFAPGQYVELALPHRRADLRGVRRTFSIASPTGPDGRGHEVAVALRVPEPCSSYKRALLDLEPGAELRATGVGGDFLLRGERPVVLVAGGIGITPFVSQLRSEGPRGLAGRDAVLVYGVPDADEVAFRDELVATGVPVVLVAPSAPADLPEGWRHVAAPFVSADVVAAAVPDLGGRVALVSGPPAMVASLRGGLRGRAATVRTDAFAGY